MSKIVIDADMVKKILKKLDGKENVIEQYIEETTDLTPDSE